MDHARFKDISAGIQSIVLSIAVVAGGIWSVITFGALRSVAEAKAKLEALTAPSLNISIDTERVKSSSANRIGLIVRVKVENNGGQNVDLDLRDPRDAPLKLALVEPGNNGHLYAKKSYQPTYYMDIRDKDYDVTAVKAVQIKSTKILSYYFEVDEPGVYFVRFQAPSGKYGQQMQKRSGLGPKEIQEKTGLRYSGDYWASTAFVDLR